MGHRARGGVPLRRPGALTSVALAATLACAICAPRVARADTYTVDFTKLDAFDAANSTGLWNVVAGRAQAAIGATSTPGSEIGFGDGSDGDFLADGQHDLSGMTGVTVSGSAITFNTDVKSEFKFLSFHLASGFSVSVTGTKPLVIRVLGTATIDSGASISANGANGVDNGTAGVGNQLTGTIAGGQGNAGGGSGGDGGQVDGSPGGILAIAGSPTTKGGGAGGNGNNTATELGGGGGCNGAGAVAGQFGGGAAGTCGTQATIAQSFESSFLGGAGGGGGGGCVSGTCAGKVGGASGGGGGGAIHLIALSSLAVNGTILAKGGAGGVNNADNHGAGFADCGGGGGGGSGGSIWLQSASTVSGSGTIDVTGGSGGTSVTCAGFGYDGGAGSAGAYRADGSATTLGAPDKQNTTVIPTGGTYTITSKPIPLTYGYATLDVPTETLDTTSTGCGTAGTLAVTYEGSNDGVTFEHAVDKTRISELNDYSYIRFKATITTTGATPPCLTGLSIPYGPRDLSDLQLRGGGIFCGSLVATQGNSDKRGPRGPSGPGGPTAPSPLGALGDLALLALSAAIARGQRRPRNA